jgi:hypothetical protein
MFRNREDVSVILFTRRRLYLEMMREALPFLGVRTTEKGRRSKSVQGRGRISL